MGIMAVAQAQRQNDCEARISPPVSGAMGLAEMRVCYQHDDTAPVELMDVIMISSRKSALEMICYGKITCLFMFLHARPWF